MNNYRAIIFDAVGTLLHPEPGMGQVYAEVGRRHGSRRSPEELKQRFTVAFQQQEAIDAAAGHATSEARELNRWRAIVAHALDEVGAQESCFAELYEHFGLPSAWRCDPAAGGLLADLADQGLVLAMASNYDHRLRQVVAGLPELQPITHLFISSEVGWKKPGAGFFEAVERQLGFPKDSLLFVGDDLVNDYQGARSWGLPAVLLDAGRRFGGQAERRIERLEDLRNDLGLPP